MKNEQLQPYERGFVHAVAMTPGLKEGTRRSILTRYVMAVDRPALERPMMDMLETYLNERFKW